MFEFLMGCLFLPIFFIMLYISCLFFYKVLKLRSLLWLIPLVLIVMPFDIYLTDLAIRYLNSLLHQNTNQTLVGNKATPLNSWFLMGVLVGCVICHLLGLVDKRLKKLIILDKTDKLINPK